jgi:hypothetical protein
MNSANPFKISNEVLMGVVNAKAFTKVFSPRHAHLLPLGFDRQ